MRRLWLRYPVATFVVVVLTATAWGQAPPALATEGEAPADPPSPAAPSFPPSAPSNGTPRTQGPAVEASPLDTFLLRDSKGNLVPVLGMKFEEFEQLLRTQKGLAAPSAPPYTFDSLSLTGSADEQTAQLQLTATIRVRSDGWVRVPWLLKDVVITEPPKYTGPGEHFLAFEEAAGGYVCWLKGHSDQPHVVTVPVTVGVNKAGDERRLTLSLPRATESAVRLSIPEPGAIAALHAGDGLVATREANGGRSEVSVLGAAGDLELGWRPGQRPTAQRGVQLDVGGEITVRVESEHRITSDARLRVRSFGAPLESFQIRLPPGLELVPINLAGYSLTPLGSSAETDPNTTDIGQIVEVRLERPATGAVDVRLLATLRADANLASNLTPARFEVLKAVRQRGTIDFLVDGEWQLEWTLGAGVRRLDVAPDSASRAAARFEYFEQPCNLQLKVSTRPTRISVEPAHMVFVDSQQMRLQSNLKYRIRGARVGRLTLELGDWRLARLAPEELFELPLRAADRTGRVELAVRADAAMPAELELELEAHRPLAIGDERLSLTFPRPSADFVAPASIAIIAADNIELTPLTSELVGLSADAPAPRNQTPRPALAYRDLGGGEPAAFAAAIRQRARYTKAAGRATIRLQREQAEVEQRLEFHVQHEPQRDFSLLAPRVAATRGSLQVLLNGTPLEFSLSADPLGASDSLARIEFTPASPQIGSFQIETRYTLPIEGWDDQKSVALQVPIAVPVANGNYEFTGQQIAFNVAEGMHVEAAMEGLEQSLMPSVNADDGRPAYSWAQSEPLTSWLLTPARTAVANSGTVERQWVQTWLGPGVRQERVVYQLRTEQESLRIRLPKGVVPSSVQAAVDGAHAAKAYRDPGHVVVHLPSAAQRDICVLELYYVLDAPARRFGLLSTELIPAQIDGATPPRRTYWQLALPESMHLAQYPHSLATEMTGSSQRWFAPRRAALDDQQLQRWSGASRQEPLPRAANLYLFGALGTIPTLELVAAERRWMVGVASGVVLLVGLLMVHVPRLRSPTALLVLVVLLAGAALVAPQLAMLASQASLLGLAIAATSALWTLLRGRRTMPAAATPSTLATRTRDSSLNRPPLVARPDRGSQLTATAPAAAIEVRP